MIMMIMITKAKISLIREFVVPSLTFNFLPRYHKGSTGV